MTNQSNTERGALKLVDTPALAGELSVGVKTVRKWWQEGTIPGYKLGKRCVRFNPDEVREALLKPSRSAA